MTSLRLRRGEAIAYVPPMSRKIRYHFAAPLVMTLAVAPACVVRTAPPPPPSATDDGAGSVQTISNPPPPGTGSALPPPVDDRAPFPGGPPDTAQQTPATPPRLGAWTVFQNQRDHQCYVQITVDCPPKGATCNPPPPRVMDSCPTGMALDRPIQLYEQSPGVCFLQPPIPPCPRNAKCKAPAPQKTDCPSP